MISTKVQIRFADCDMAGHIHNAAYLHYFEQARMHFFDSQLKDWDWKKTGFILKKNIVEYQSPTRLKDLIHVEVECNHIGTKSFTLSYTVKDADNNIKCTGESVVVCFNYISNKTIAIPTVLIDILKNHFSTDPTA